MTPCILWSGSMSRDGYGLVHGGKAHRAAYERSVGPVPAGMDIDHLCFVKACVNPEHLRPLDPIENRRLQRSASKPRCTNGHPYDARNTYRRPSGGRDCRACIRSRVRKYKGKVAA